MERVSERRYLIEGGWVGASFQHRPTTDFQYADSKGGMPGREFPRRGMQGGIKAESKGRDRHP